MKVERQQVLWILGGITFLGLGLFLAPRDGPPESLATDASGGKPGRDGAPGAGRSTGAGQPPAGSPAPPREAEEAAGRGAFSLALEGAEGAPPSPAASRDGAQPESAGEPDWGVIWPGRARVHGVGPGAPSGAPARTPARLRVTDAVDGRALPGATVEVLHFPGAQPGTSAAAPASGNRRALEQALDLWAAATSPPPEPEQLTTDSRGEVEVPCPDPDNPRLAALALVEKPGYAPASVILTLGSGRHGEYMPAGVQLRRQLTFQVIVADEGGRPLPRSPLRVHGAEPSADLLDARVTREPGGGLARITEASLRYTGSDGSFRLPVNGLSWRFELLAPEAYLFEARGARVRNDRVTGFSPLEGPLRLWARPRQLERLVLQDRDGFPIARAPVLLELGQMPPLRLLTDDAGALTPGLTPPLPHAKPLTAHSPLDGKLTILDPRIWRRSVPVRLPAILETIRVPAQPARTLRLRLVAAESGEGLPVEAAALHVPGNWTLVRAGGAGDVELVGDLPEPGEPLLVRLAGRLPARAVMPAGKLLAVVDLGDLPLERGLERTIELVGAPLRALEGAVLSLVRRDGSRGAASGAEPPARFPLNTGTGVTLGGLEPGLYQLSVEGPHLRRLESELEVNEVLPTVPTSLELEPTVEEEITVAGKVLELTPFECARVEVFERWTLAGGSVVAGERYTLSPDGSFGSRSRRVGVEALELAIVGPDQRATFLARSRRGGPPAFLVGEVRLQPCTVVEATFRVSGLGLVLPPRQVSLEGPGGLAVSARFSRRGHKLLITGIPPGSYRLGWQAGNLRESATFALDRVERSRLVLELERAPQAEEKVLLLAMDSRGEPLRGASEVKETKGSDPVEAGAGEEEDDQLPGEADGVGLESPGGRDPSLDLAPGLFPVTIRPGQEQVLHLSAPEKLPLRLRLAAGDALPPGVTFFAGASIAGEVFERTGRRYDGLLHLSWRSVTPSRIEVGEELSVAIDHGRLSCERLPPGLHDLHLRADGSEAVHRRRVMLVEGAVLDLERIILEETRRIAGRAQLADGSPAPNVWVGLVPRDSARRYPLRKGGLDRAIVAVQAEGATGSFAIDALPTDLTGDLALVAEIDGLFSAVEEPLDLDQDEHLLTLRPCATLNLVVGFEGGGSRPGHSFWLEHVEDPADPDARTPLGELPGGNLPGVEFAGVEPGVYRVRFGLRSAYAPLPGRIEEVVVEPGGSARLECVVSGKLLQGKVTYNNRPLDRGWVLLTADPTSSDATVGRVSGGELVLLDPPQAFRAYAAVIPEQDPQGAQNLIRGEGLPVTLAGYHLMLQRGFLSIEYSSHDLTLQIDPGLLLRQQGITLSIDHYAWDGTKFRPYPVEELIEEPTLRLFGLAEGSHRIGVKNARGTMVFSQVVPLEKATVMAIR